ncbi:MAG: DUF305 domain-containing protein [Thermoleophilaceae bacterium]
MSYSKMMVAVLTAGALIAAGCGEDDAGSAAGNEVDRAFTAEMVPHHESAVVMAKIARDRGQSRFVKALADDIVRTQNQEIDLMRREDTELAAAGVEKGSLGVPEHMMGMDGAPASLKAANPFDREFIGMMLPHHEGALVMAKAELAKGESAELKALARSILSTQQQEITAMRRHLGTDPPRQGAGRSG